MKFDFSSLRQRIDRQFGTLQDFGSKTGLPVAELALKLDNRRPFLASDVVKISDALGIPGDEIELYFFIPKFD